MALADVFRTTEATPPGNIPLAAAGASAPATPGTAANGVVPAGATAGASANPLDQHKDLWNNPTNADGTAIVPANTDLFTVDPKQLMDAAGKVDFTKVIKPEQMAAIKAGGDGAATALAEMLQATAAGVYAQSAFAATKIVEDGIKRSTEANDKKLAETIRTFTASEALRQDNPAFSHPAAAPILNDIQTRMAVKFPDASSAELAKMSKDYLANLAAAFQPSTPANNKTGGSKEQDWSEFI